MQTFVIAVVTILSLSIGIANAQSLSYNAPAHNYYKNNWMSGRA